MAERPQGRPYVPYDIPLGEGERVRLVLPADLTQAEADRICGVIQTLPFGAAGEAERPPGWMPWMTRSAGPEVNEP